MRDAAEQLGIKNSGAKRLVDSLVGLGVLRTVDDRAYARRYHAPAVMDVLLGR